MEREVVIDDFTVETRKEAIPLNERQSILQYNFSANGETKPAPTPFELRLARIKEIFSKDRIDNDGNIIPVVIDLAGMESEEFFEMHPKIDEGEKQKVRGLLRKIALESARLFYRDSGKWKVAEPDNTMWSHHYKSFMSAGEIARAGRFTNGKDVITVTDTLKELYKRDGIKEGQMSYELNELLKDADVSLIGPIYYDMFNCPSTLRSYVSIRPYLTERPTSLDDAVYEASCIAGNGVTLYAQSLGKDFDSVAALYIESKLETLIKYALGKDRRGYPSQRLVRFQAAANNMVSLIAGVLGKGLVQEDLESIDPSENNKVSTYKGRLESLNGLPEAYEDFVYKNIWSFISYLCFIDPKLVPVSIRTK